MVACIVHGLDILLISCKGSYMDYEVQLAAEGLAPLDVGTRVSSRGDSSVVGGRQYSTVNDSAGEAWKAWAKRVGDQLGSDSRLLLRDPTLQLRRESIWAKYAEGETFADIALAVGCHESVVARTVRRITRSSPAAPVRNPWRKLPGGEPEISSAVMARVVGAIASCCDPWMLADAVHNDPKLSSLIGDYVPKVATQRYVKIEMTRSLVIPGLPGARDKIQLQNVQGRPHAGGIDVVVGDTVHTVPWGCIYHAVRESDDD